MCKVDTYEVHQSLREDLNEGSIWLLDPSLCPQIRNKRRIVKISRGAASVCCEALYATEDYLGRRRWGGKDQKHPGHRMIFLSGWYRAHLRIDGPPGTRAELKIDLGNYAQQLGWQVAACIDHPQVAVFLSTILGVIGLGLAFIAIFPAFKDLCWIDDFRSGVLTICTLLLLVAILLALLFRRARISTRGSSLW